MSDSSRRRVQRDPKNFPDVESIGVNTEHSTDQDEVRLLKILDDILLHREQGKTIDIEAYVAQNPDLGDRIRECVVSLDAVERLASGLASSTNVHEQTKESLPLLDDYQVVKEVGRGGMGIVYEAHQISLNRRVALKVLPFARIFDQKQILRFQNESLAAAQLFHPNIVSVYSVGCSNGLHFYSMQFVDGVSLREFLDYKRNQISSREQTNAAQGQATDEMDHIETSAVGRGNSDTLKSGSYTNTDRIESKRYVETVCRLTLKAARALQHAHESGVVHRDIKPANLMIDSNGELQITDFGLARLEVESGVTASGDIVGTLRYMSPEQAIANGPVVDHRTDLYSLGLTLYELLTLEPVVNATNRAQILTQIMTDSAVNLRKKNRFVSRDLETIVYKATEKDRDRRYSDAEGLADDLQRYLENRPIKATPQTLFDRISRFAMRHRELVGSGIVALLLLSIGLAVSNAKVKTALTTTEAAKHESDLFLKESLIEGARSLRFSHRPGRQVGAIEKITTAADLSKKLGTYKQDEVQLRSEAVASLAWSDVVHEFDLNIPPSVLNRVKFDQNLTKYIRASVDKLHLGFVDKRGLDERVVNVPGIQGIFFSSDGNWICYFVDFVPHIASWAEPNKSVSLPKPDMGPVCNFQVNPSGTYCVLAKLMGNHFVVYDVRNSKIAFTRKRFRDRSYSGFFPKFVDDRSLMLPGTLFSDCGEIVDIKTQKTVDVLIANENSDGYAIAVDARPTDGLFLTCSNKEVVVWKRISINGKVSKSIVGRRNVGDFVARAQFHSDDLVGIVTVQNDLRVWDFKHDQLFSVSQFATHKEYAQNSSRIIAKGTSKYKVYSFRPSKIYKTLPGHRAADTASTMSVSSDGSLLSTTGNDVTRIYDLQRLEFVTTVPVAVNVNRSQTSFFHPRRNRLFTSSSDGLVAWDINEPTDEKSPRFMRGPKTILAGMRECGEFSVDSKGEKIAFFQAAVNPTMYVASLTNGLPIEEPTKLPYEKPELGYIFSPIVHMSSFGKFAAVNGAVKGPVVVWDLESKKQVHVDKQALHGCVRFSPDESLLVKGGKNAYEVLSTKNWKLEFAIPANELLKHQNLATFTSDSSCLAVVTSANEISIFHAPTKKLIVNISTPFDTEISQIAFTPDDSRLIMNSGSQVVQLLDMHVIARSLKKFGLGFKFNAPFERAESNEEKQPPIKQLAQPNEKGDYEIDLGRIPATVSHGYEYAKNEGGRVWYPGENSELEFEFYLNEGTYSAYVTTPEDRRNHMTILLNDQPIPSSQQNGENIKQKPTVVRIKNAFCRLRLVANRNDSGEPITLSTLHLEPTVSK